MANGDDYIKRPEQHILEDESRLLFMLRLPREWIKRCKIPDYGEDIEVQIVDGDRVTEKVFWVQLKATNTQHDKFPIAFSKMKTKNLKQYEISPFPIFITYFVKPHNAFYCIFAQKYIKEVLPNDSPNWRMQETVTIKFNEDSKITDFRILDQNYQNYLHYVYRNNPKSTLGNATYWYNGIPQSDNEELKKRVMNAHLYILDLKPEKAIEVFEGILRELVIAPIEKMSILLNLGITYYLRHKNEKAMKNFESIFEVAKKIDDINAKVGEAHALNCIGLIYQSSENWDEALRYFEKSLNSFENMGEKLSEASVLGNIALNYKEKSKKVSKFDKALKNAELDKALDYAKRELEICKEVGYKLGEALALVDIGLIYGVDKEWDESLKYYNESLDMQREMNHKLGEALILGNIGSDYYIKGEFKAAMQYSEDSLRINQEIGNIQGIAYQIGMIGLILEAQSKFKEAKKYLKEAINSLDNIGLKYGKDIFEQALKEIEEKE